MADIDASIGIIVTGGSAIDAVIRKVQKLEDAINRIRQVQVGVVGPRSLPPAVQQRALPPGVRGGSLGSVGATRGGQRTLPPGTSIPVSQQVINVSARRVATATTGVANAATGVANAANNIANAMRQAARRVQTSAGAGGGGRGGPGGGGGGWGPVGGGGPSGGGWGGPGGGGPGGGWFSRGGGGGRGPGGGGGRRFNMGRMGASFSGGLQGAAFPLMFGQGMGAVAGGGLGGVLGGALLGPGGSFAGAGLGTAVGMSFDAVSTKIKTLAKDLDDPAKALEAVAAAGAKVTDSERAISAYLISIGRSGDAFDMARNKMDAAFGPGAFAGLRVLQTSQSEFQAAITKIAGALGQQLLPNIIAITDYFTALTTAAEPLAGVLVGLADVFGYVTVFVGNNIKGILDIVEGFSKGGVLGGIANLPKALADRANAESFGGFKQRAQDKLDAARSGPAAGLQQSPFQQLEEQERARAEMTRQRDAALGMERASLDIARQREDIERSITDLQQKWARTLQQQELARKRQASDNLRQNDQLGIERTANQFAEQRRGLVSEDAKSLLDGLSTYIQQRATGEADLRQKEREFQISTKELAIRQSQLEEDTAKEVFSINRQTADYTRAVEDFKIKVADYQYQRAMDAAKLGASMSAVGGGGGTNNALAALVKKVESGGDYGAFNLGGRAGGTIPIGSGSDPNLTKNTIGNVMARQSAPGGLHAAGAYQIIGSTLRGLMKGDYGDIGGLTKDSLFSPENQDKLFVALARNRKTVAGLRQEWVGLNNVDTSQLQAALNGGTGGVGGAATGTMDKEVFRQWLYSQGMGRTSGDFTNAGHKTHNHMLNAMDMGFTDSKYDSNYVQKTVEMERKLRATGAFGDQLFGPERDPKGHKNHLHIPTPGGRVPTNPALLALMGTVATTGGMSPEFTSRNAPTFQAPSGAPAMPNSAGFLAGSRADMQADINLQKESLEILRKITDERNRGALMGAVGMFDGDKGALAGLQAQLGVTKEIAAIDSTLPGFVQEQLASQIEYNAKLDEAAAGRRESFAIVEEALKAGQLTTEEAAKLNQLLTAGYRTRQEILATEQQITEQTQLQARNKAFQDAANNIQDFRRGYDAGYGPDAGAYNSAYRQFGPEAAGPMADVARVGRLQQQAVGDAQAIAGALTGGIVQAIEGGNFKEAASQALSSISGRIIERAFRPLEEFLMGMLTRLLAPGNSQVGGAASGLLGLVPGVAGLFGGGGGGAGGGVGGFVTGGLFDTPFSYAGGGYTGDGSRSGGVDGLGGFPAILHPRETVVDHTDTRAMLSNGTSAMRSTAADQQREAVLASTQNSSMQVEWTKVGDLEVVTRDEFIKGMSVTRKQAAKEGQARVVSSMRRDPAFRREMR